LKSILYVAINRENTMIELKKEVNQLSAELGRPEPYDLKFIEEDKNLE